MPGEGCSHVLHQTSAGQSSDSLQDSQALSVLVKVKEARFTLFISFLRGRPLLCTDEILIRAALLARAWRPT